MARHEHAHEFLGVAVAGLAGDDDLLDVLGVEVADRALDERAFLVHQRRRARFEREIAHLLPDPQQVFEVALHLQLGARGAGGAQDHAHALRHVELLGDLAQLLAVVGAGDLAADAAAARGVGHQHAVAAGEREVGGQRRALGAALFLDDLHQHDLAALDHFLDLVGTAVVARRAIRNLFHRVGAADELDDLFLFVMAVGVALIVSGRWRGAVLAGGAYSSAVARVALGAGLVRLPLRRDRVRADLRRNRRVGCFGNHRLRRSSAAAGASAGPSSRCGSAAASAGASGADRPSRARRPGFPPRRRHFARRRVAPRRFALGLAADRVVLVATLAMIAAASAAASTPAAFSSSSLSKSRAARASASISACRSATGI